MEDFEDYRSLIKDLCMDNVFLPKGLALKKHANECLGPKKNIDLAWKPLEMILLRCSCGGSVRSVWMIKTVKLKIYPRLNSGSHKNCRVLSSFHPLFHRILPHWNNISPT